LPELDAEAADLLDVEIEANAEEPRATNVKG
jgi:hypothetical protein